MKDEKSLLEEILDRKKSIKNGLLDNDEIIFSSKNQKFSETKKFFFLFLSFIFPLSKIFLKKYFIF